MNDTSPLGRRHFRFGWCALCCFSAIGIALELLHAFKSGAYLDVGSETRRLMWRLGHAHGALLGLVNIAFAVTVELRSRDRALRLGWPSRCLVLSGVLLPLGFLLGGVFADAADPGLPILLVPIGAALLVLGMAWAARATW